MNRHALRLTQRLGFCYASDCRGNFPFIPVIDGELVHCPQLPTTLPTLDELLVTETTSAAQAAEQSSPSPPHRRRPRLHLARRARGNEVQGCVRGTARRLDEQGLSTGRLARSAQLAQHRHPAAPHRRFCRMPGRFGQRMVQGPAFLLVYEPVLNEQGRPQPPLPVRPPDSISRDRR
jgi:undecaprenyl phosphate-alpha-L-ara4FN deformylase